MTDTVSKQKNQVSYWRSEISSAKKREKDFRKDGERILAIYEGKKSATTPFNILFSNTETLLPALYSNIPRPVVDRRFKDDDPVGKSAGLAGERMLTYLIDTNVDGYETFDEAMRSATLDALLPGRGVTCEKYDADVDLPTESVDDESPVPEGAAPETAAPATPAAPAYGAPDDAGPYKKSELVCSDTRSWNRVFFGYAKKWSKVPWIAFEEHIDRTEATRLFGTAIATQLKYSQADGEEEREESDKNEETDQGERKTATVYQIWDKAGGRKIRYVSDQYKDDFLKVQDDPLELTGFYSMPRPLMFLEKSNDLLPTAMYLLYENQAKELNEIQRRISRIVKAIKAKGIYDGELGDDLKRLLEADDNELVPTDKTSSLSAEKGLQNAIWFLPLDQLVATLQQLYQARESCKQVIYEITGIADIMRGASNASETLGAQEIKQSWGTLRLKRLQKEVQRYARDLLRIKLEIAATKFSEDTWARMTGLPFLTSDHVAQLQKVGAALQQQVQQEQMQQPPQMPPPPGQPPQPPQPSPAQQQLEQIQQQLQTPKWSDILGLLQDDLQRSYRIDIETNSTVDAAAVEDQKNIADVMNALGQFLNSVGPLVAKGVMPYQAAQSMMLAIVRRFRFGAEIEDYVKQMKPPPPPEDPNAGAAQQQQMAQEAHQQDMAAKQQDQQAKAQELAMKGQLAEKQSSLDMARMDREAQYAQQEHEAKMEELAQKRELAAFVSNAKMQAAQATAAAKMAAAQPGAA